MTDTTATTTTSTTPTVDDITNAIMNLMRASDPLALFMKQRGFDPEKGGLLILPSTLLDLFPMGAPTYVRFSPHVHDAILINRDYL